MNPIRKFLAIPFYVSAYLICVITVIADILGAAVSFAGAWVEGAK